LVDHVTLKFDLLVWNVYCLYDCL